MLCRSKGFVIFPFVEKAHYRRIQPRRLSKLRLRRRHVWALIFASRLLRASGICLGGYQKSTKRGKQECQDYSTHRGSSSYFFGGLLGRISIRLGKARSSWRKRSITTHAMSC